MLRSSRIRSAVASSLLALLGALGTGLPSHHHDPPADPAGQPHLFPADYHTHATLLVEQDERVPSSTSQPALTSTVSAEPASPTGAPLAFVPKEPLRPLERAPPSASPRAPPLSA